MSYYPDNNNLQIHHQPLAFIPPGFDPNITFVQADPTTFREVVQKLTGKPTTTTTTGVKLHERRATARKLEIQLNNNNNSNSNSTRSSNNINNMVVMASPVSTLEFMPRSPMAIEQFAEEESRAIADKGFYFHPSPITTPRGSDPPQLLPLFPLSSPTSSHEHHPTSR